MDVIWTKFNHMVDGSKVTAQCKLQSTCRKEVDLWMLSGPSSTTWWTVLKSLLNHSVSSSQHAERRQAYGCYLDQVQPHGGRF